MPDAIQRSLALLVSVLTLPLLAALAVAVRVETRGAPIYSATRVGEGGRPFTCFKIRTMVTDQAPGQRLTRARDPRVTRVGRLLRPKAGRRALVYELVTRGSLEVGQARRRRAGLAARTAAAP